MVGNKDRLTAYIETLQDALEKLKTHQVVRKFLVLQERLDTAREIDAAVLAAEEAIADLQEPKKRKPRTATHQAKMPMMAPPSSDATLHPSPARRETNADISTLQDKQE